MLRRLRLYKLDFITLCDYTFSIELIEPNGVLLEVVNYVYKSKEEATEQIRRRVEFGRKNT